VYISRTNNYDKDTEMKLENEELYQAAGAAKHHGSADKLASSTWS